MKPKKAESKKRLKVQPRSQGLPESMEKEVRSILKQMMSIQSSYDLMLEGLEESVRELVLENFRRGNAKHVLLLPDLFKERRASVLLLKYLDGAIRAYK